jgi:phage baseplate assembly protein W
MSIYSGFSTVSSDAQKKFVLTDRKLIQQDLLNALKTRRGQRLMQPNFGCIIWDKLFDNITQTDLDDISANISSIINNDPRITLVSLDLTQGQHTITVTVIIQYVNTNETDQLIVNFNSELSSDF